MRAAGALILRLIGQAIPHVRVPVHAMKHGRDASQFILLNTLAAFCGNVKDLADVPVPTFGLLANPGA